MMWTHARGATNGRGLFRIVHIKGVVNYDLVHDDVFTVLAGYAPTETSVIHGKLQTAFYWHH